jgi:hypothetical protein
MEQPGKCVEFVGISVTAAGLYEFLEQLPPDALAAQLAGVKAVLR